MIGQDWVDDTRDHLEGSNSGEANILDADYVAGSGSVTLRFPLGNVSANAILSVGANTMRVFATSQTARTAEVTAGFRGSTDADAPAGTLVRVNPKFTDHRIFKELNNHLATLSSPRVGLFRATTEFLDYLSFVQGYSLNSTDVIQVLEVRREVHGPSGAWPRVGASEWDLVESAPSDVFSTGQSIRVKEGDTGLRVQVVLATAFNTLASTLDDVVVTGLPDTATDIPPLGAAIRLMSGREIGRNLATSQGDTRRDEKVPPGAIQNSSAGLRALWDTRVKEEAARLTKKYPVGA